MWKNYLYFLPKYLDTGIKSLYLVLKNVYFGSYGSIFKKNLASTKLLS